jgi:hypothetical protein
MVTATDVGREGKENLRGLMDSLRDKVRALDDDDWKYMV